MHAIEAKKLGKSFRIPVRKTGPGSWIRNLLNPETKEFTAVDDIDFAIEPGESVAYLGPNGAGKSTTIKMLTGILVPSRGEVLVDGRVPHKNRKRNSRSIGAVFGQRSQLLFDLPVEDSFELLRCMYDIPTARYRQNLKTFSEVLETGDLLDRTVRTLSLGQRMRCEIQAALLHDPDILFLDEPTIGLDVVAKERIREFIDQMNRERGVTVLLTTHDLGDIERLCRRLMIIDHGRLMYDGKLDYIRDNYATQRSITAVFHSSDDAVRMHDWFAGRGGCMLKHNELSLSITYDHRGGDTALYLKTLLEEGKPKDLSMSGESIETIIARIYREGISSVEKNAK